MKQVIILPRTAAIEVRDSLLQQLAEPTLTKEEAESLSMRLDSITKALEAENHAIEARTHAIEASKRGNEILKIGIGAGAQGALLVLIMLFEKYSDHFLPMIARGFTPKFNFKN